MSQGPQNPTEAQERVSTDDSGELRNVFCHAYESCLNHAVRRNWRNWTCAKCPLVSATGDRPNAEKFAHRRIRQDWI